MGSSGPKTLAAALIVSHQAHQRSRNPEYLDNKTRQVKVHQQADQQQNGTAQVNAVESQALGINPVELQQHIGADNIGGPQHADDIGQVIAHGCAL